MGDTILAPSSKHPKLSKEPNVGEGKDIISSLPGNVLHHILSFLSTEDIIRTLVLSRRWKYLWTSISNIDLTEESFGACKKKDKGEKRRRSFFSDFVDRILLLHDATDIKRLNLTFSTRLNSYRLNSWISAAIRHNVQELDLSLPVETRFVLPCGLFTCESLVTLKLFMDCALEVPNFIRFSNLKTLKLYKVSFSDDNSIQLLLSGCPVLEELALVTCGWHNIKTITISIPTLKKLAIESDSMWTDDDVLGRVINIDTANLIDLRCISSLIVEFRLCDLPLLVDASMTVLYELVPIQDIARRSRGLFNAIHNVKNLSISNDTLRFLMYFEGPGYLPTFYNMTHLRLHEEFYYSELSDVLMDFLEKSPNLEFLDFVGGSDPYEEYSEDDDLAKFERVPSCFESSLKTCRILGFLGCKGEMHFLRFLLKNASVLERVRVHCCSAVTEEEQQEFSNHLKGLPRASESCAVELLHHSTSNN